jgi:PIN domain nuclease of toxin-antitoxin system
MRFVLDASAVLAGLNGESGADRVASALDGAVVSAVNFAEVAGGLARSGNSPERVRAVLQALACAVILADEEMAIDAGLMRALTDRAVLSLGDRFCLAPRSPPARPGHDGGQELGADCGRRRGEGGVDSLKTTSPPATGRCGQWAYVLRRTSPVFATSKGRAGGIGNGRRGFDSAVRRATARVARRHD